MKRIVLSVIAAVLVLSAGVSAQKRSAVFVDPVDPTVLRTECLTNPNAYTWTEGAVTQTLTQWYTAGADAIVANILNQTRAGITIFRSDVDPQEVREAVSVSQFTTAATQQIATLQATWLNAFFNGSQVRLLTKTGTDTRVMTNLLVLLTNGSASETRLRALASRTGSRGEQLFGCTTFTDPGCEVITVQPFHVTAARNLP
jgi:hypothetical protein